MDWQKIRPILSAGYGRMYSETNIGAAYAFKIERDKSLPIRILHTRMHLRTNHNDEPVKLRCRITGVDPETGWPGDDLMHYNIIGSAKDRGWVTCDFSAKNIYIDKSSFFAVFEWLRDSSKPAEQRVAPMFSIGLFLIRRFL